MSYQFYMSAEQLRKLYIDEDMTPPQIARACNMPVSRVYTLLDRYGYTKYRNARSKIYTKQHRYAVTQARRTIFRKEDTLY